MLLPSLRSTPLANGSHFASLLVSFLFLALLCFAGLRASPSIASTTERKNDVMRIERPHNSLGPFEKYILEHMQKANNADPNRRHVRLLLSEQDSYDFKAQLSTVDILHRSKFQYQVFDVTSKDGYITQLVRIINPLVRAKQLKCPPVVMYGGQSVSAAVFIMASLGTHAPAQWPQNESWPNQVNGANQSLAITLANNGYDVWLVGARGSDRANSRRVPKPNTEQQHSHDIASITAETLGSKSGLESSRKLFDERFKKLVASFAAQNNDYWSFSHDEIIQYEFKAQLECIMRETKQEKVTLITYSNGGFIAYAFAASHSDFAHRHIDTMISLAPAVFVNKFNLVLGTSGLLSSLKSDSNSTVLDETLDMFARGLWHKVCRSKVVRYSACKFALNLLYGFSDHFQTHIELNLADYTGRPMSAKGFRQTLQCSYSGRLQHYDHGFLGNLAKYKNFLPPVYDLKLVHLERAFVFSGERDAIVDAGSVKKLLSSCGGAPANLFQVPGYNHQDMVAGWDVKDSVNTPVLSLLNDRHLELSYYNEDKPVKQSDSTQSSLKLAAGSRTSVAPLFVGPNVATSKTASAASLVGSKSNGGAQANSGAEHGAEHSQAGHEYSEQHEDAEEAEHGHHQEDAEDGGGDSHGSGYGHEGEEGAEQASDEEHGATSWNQDTKDSRRAAREATKATGNRGKSPRSTK